MENIIEKIRECEFKDNDLNAIISKCNNNKEKIRIEKFKNKILLKQEIKDINIINLIKKITDFQDNMNYLSDTFMFKILLDDDTFVFECNYSEINNYYSIYKKSSSGIEKVFDSVTDDYEKIKSNENINILSNNIEISEPIKFIESIYSLFDIIKKMNKYNEDYKLFNM